jgi:ComF family protein
VSIVLPAGCRLCERLLTRATRLPICDECLGSFVRIHRPICDSCGLPLETFAGTDGGSQQEGGDSVPQCAACRLQAYRFERARSVFRYQDGVVRAIVMLKFEEMDPLADWFAARLAELARSSNQTDVDVVVAVPLHKVRQRERGFNQAELLSKRLAKLLKVPHQGVLLVRKRPRPDKHLLTERERWEAVRGAFAARADSQVDNQRVLLVDDVMTTGATLDACAKALRDAGARAVYGLTVARAVARNPRHAGR